MDRSRPATPGGGCIPASMFHAAELHTGGRTEGVLPPPFARGCVLFYNTRTFSMVRNIAMTLSTPVPLAMLCAGAKR
jgi:hypothetical protein